MASTAQQQKRCLGPEMKNTRVQAPSCLSCCSGPWLCVPGSSPCPASWESVGGYFTMQNQEDRWKNSGSSLGNAFTFVRTVGCKDSWRGRRCCCGSYVPTIAVKNTSKAFAILKSLSQYGSNLNVH